MTNSGISCLRAVKERRMRAAGLRDRGVLPHENKGQRFSWNRLTPDGFRSSRRSWPLLLRSLRRRFSPPLVLGILTGTLIYTIGMDGNVLMGTLESAFTVMGNKVDFNILIFCSLLGALVYVVAMSGGTKAYGNWAVKRIKGRKSALAATTGLGALIFIDDYFNCLTVGTVMRPICDRYNIARAKLAYIIDSTAAPVCIIAPVSSWAAAVGSSLQGSTAFESDMAAFIATIPWNFYALLCLLLIVFIVVTDFDFGPMRKSEERAAREQFTSTAAASSAEPPNANPHGTLWGMLVPIASLIVFCVLALMYSGGYWGADPKYHTFASALGNSSAAPSLVWASFGAVGIAFPDVRPARSRAVHGLHERPRRRHEAHASGQHHPGARLDALRRLPRPSPDPALRAVHRDLGRRRVVDLPAGRDLRDRRLPVLLYGHGLGARLAS